MRFLKMHRIYIRYKIDRDFLILFTIVFFVEMGWSSNSRDAV